MGQIVTKLTSIPQDDPQTYRVRQHKPTSGELLMSDLFLNSVFDLIIEFKHLEEAVTTFHRELSHYANRHIPVKTKLQKTSSKSFISEETKNIIEEDTKLS